MIEINELLHVIDLLYAAALDGEWAVPVRAMAALFASDQAGLIQYDSRTRSPREVTLVGIEPPFQEAYAPVATRADLDPVWALTVARSFAAAPIIERYAADPELSRTELYQHWLRPQGIHEAVEVSTMAPSRTIALMSVARSAGAAEFDGDALRAMRALQPHLRQALQIRQRLDGATIERRQMLDALDRLEHGVLLVDVQGRVQHASRAAEVLLRRGDGLKLANGTLDCEQATDGHTIRRLVGAAAMGKLATEGALAVRRSRGGALSVLVIPWRHDLPSQKGSPTCACIVVTDPEQGRADGVAELLRRYGLTPAEARTVLALLEGGGLSAVAERLSVSLSTVRTLIQRVFAKTGTHRQSELVRLIMAPDIHSGVET